MLTHLALITLILAVGAQAPNPKKKTSHPRTPVTTVAPAPGADPSADPLAPGGFTVVRRADCVLVLKGQIVRRVSLVRSQGEIAHRPKASGAAEEKNPTPTSAPRAMNGQTLEHFEYELPGTLTEETDPKSTLVRFRFTPVAGLKPGMAQARLHLEDQSKGPQFPPMVVEATEVMGADPFVFEAAARGQQLVPVSGMVILKGRIQNAAPTGAPVTMVAPVGPPVVSLPLPPLKSGVPGTPSLQFQGISLWAWPNSKGPFTVASTIVYNIAGAHGSLTGSVEVAFRVGPTR